MLCHNHPGAGHFRTKKTYAQLKEHYTWPCMKRDTEGFVHRCSMYSQIKHYQRLPLGTSHPLPMPSAPWQDMSMDLVSGLPLVRGIDMVCIVVDRLTKEI